MAVGRYAPSPTGTFHIGNLRTALLAWLIARKADSEFLLRWEDLDLTASSTHEVSQTDDLAALGIDFDGAAWRQSDRLGEYRSVVAALQNDGLVYRCWCSRKDIREATAAPHGATGSYPGTCRHLSAAEISKRERGDRPPALRLRTEVTNRPVHDTIAGDLVGEVDDFVLQRGDGTPAYNLAVVVDDSAQGVREVVRGDDLLASSARQGYLCDLLGLSEPTWTHVPLCADANGDRLAKRDGSAGLSAWRDAGGTVGTLLRDMAVTLGLGGVEATCAADLLQDFDLAALPRRPSLLRLFASESGSPEPKLALSP